MNGKTLQGLLQTTRDPLFAWDSYRRFIEHYAEVVMGLDSSIFDTITTEALKGFGLASREELNAAQSEEIVGRFVDELSRRGLAIPDDVYEQLRQAVLAVYASWNSKRAVQFRRATRTSA